MFRPCSCIFFIIMISNTIMHKARLVTDQHTHMKMHINLDTMNANKGILYMSMCSQRTSIYK